jgi:glycosyltransferase involved in cell wall biosynthesis
VLHDFHAEVEPYYQSVDLLVLPSVNEGLPNVVLEAMASGLPCVAARASGSRELVADGETGYTYAPDDVHALGQAVQMCLSPMGAVMGAIARRHAQERYSIGAIADRYEAIYSQIIGQPANLQQAGRTDERTIAANQGRSAARTVVFVENGIGYGGAVTCLRHLVRTLDRSKYLPVVVTGQSTGPYAGIAEDARWLSIQDRRIDVTELRRRLAAARWPDRVRGLRWVLLQCIARLDDLANSLPFFLRLSWMLVRTRPAIVHVNNEPLCNRAAVVSAKILGIPLVSHVRGDQFGSRSMALLFRLPDQFIAVSRWIADDIAKLGVSATRSTLIYDGIDFVRLNRNADGAAFRSEHGIPRDAFAVGLPGVLIAWKGQALLLEATLALVEEFPNLHTVIVGGTPDECRPYEQELRAFVARYGLQDRVTFTGHVADMSAAYKALDVVVSASTSPEPLGVVVVEAMAMGRPIIAPAHGGALEVVEHEHTGLLFLPNDAPALAGAIHRCLTDAALRERIAAAGRAQVIDTFSITTSTHAVEALYDRLLAEKRR